jgi:similar to stage IV sporulation protein
LTEGTGVLLIRLWNYLQGYVIIKITGEYGERLLNQAALKGLYLWDVRREGREALTAKISVKGFFSLYPLARKTRCRIFILRRVGLFFLTYRLKKRKMLLAGAILFVAAVYLLSCFVWSVEIDTSDDELKGAVKKDLERWGLREGVFKYTIDRKNYADMILAKYREVAWAQIHVRGSRVVVELVKKELPPELEENIPCDIIASKDGIIEEIIALRGEPLVKPGDTVSAGDVLITGRVAINPGQVRGEEDGETGTLLVHARGIVKARVWYQKVVRIPLVKIENKYTGNVKKAFKLQIGERVLSFQWGDVGFSMYESEISGQRLLLPRFLGDVRLITVIYREVEKKKEFLGVEGAVEEAERELLKQLGTLPDGVNVTQKKMDFRVDADKKAVIGSMTLEVIEDIGKERQIN